MYSQGISKGPNVCILTVPYFWEAKEGEISLFRDKENWSPERICDPLKDTQQARGRQAEIL